MGAGAVPVLVDPELPGVKGGPPLGIGGCHFGKEKSGNQPEMADKTIALGPGFTAGKDVDLVIETQRGHNLGRIIGNGQASPNTGTPGMIAGYGKERVIHSPATGILLGRVRIGDRVEKGQAMAVIVTRAGGGAGKGQPDSIVRGTYKRRDPREKGA